MPLKWIEPEVAMTIRGVDIFHTYRNESAENQKSYWYSTDISENGDYEFDVRVLPLPSGVRSDQHELIVAHALDNDLLPFEDEPDIQPLLVISSVSKTAAESAVIEVDASSWLIEAGIDELVEQAVGGWGKEGRTEHIATWLQSRNYQVATLMHDVQDASTVSVTINGPQALAFLQQSREDAYWEVLSRTGRAVKVEGIVESDVTLRNDAVAYAELSESLFAKYVELDEAGLPQLDVLGLSGEREFCVQADAALRKEAYKATVADGPHNWTVSSTDDIRSHFEIAI